MEEKKYFRIGTLFSAILHILAGISVGISALILVFAFSKMATDNTASSIFWALFGGWFFLIIILLIGIAVAVTAIVIGSKEIRMIPMKPNEYKNKKGKIIGHLVYDAIMLALLVFVAFLFKDDKGYSWISFFSIGEAAAFGLAFASLLSSRINFSIKVKNGKISQEELNPPKNNPVGNSNGIVVDQKSSAENLEQELVKLKELKEKGLLSDEEYEQQRKSVLEKHSK